LKEQKIFTVENLEHIIKINEPMVDMTSVTFDFK
jgi:hypothetical protein